jgi:16S rRNA (guanine527-N7)-methyltransferase
VSGRESSVEQERELLRSGLRQAGLPAGEETEQRLLGFLRELRLWNRRLSLVADAGPALVTRHLLDSLAPLPLLRDLGGLQQSADVGSGNGFPALPLLLCAQEMQVSMIERSGRKAGFLRNAAALPGVDGRARVVQEDVRRVAGRGERFPLVLSRAFLPFSRAFELLEPLRQRPAGHLVYYGGRRAVLEEELQQLGADDRRRCELLPIEVPLLQEERNLVVVGD